MSETQEHPQAADANERTARATFQRFRAACATHMVDRGGLGVSTRICLETAEAFTVALARECDAGAKGDDLYRACVNVAADILLDTAGTINGRRPTPELMGNRFLEVSRAVASKLTRGPEISETVDITLVERGADQ